MASLTGKQQAFILEYPKDFNATQAAIRAGYSKKTAHVIGHENLRKPKLREAIQKEFSQRTISLDEVLFRLTEQATASVGDFVTVNPDGDRISVDPDMIHKQGHLIKNIKAKTTVKYSKQGDQFEYTTIEVSLYDSQKALELIGKHYGMFKQEVVLNWRKQAEDAGVSPSDLFEEMVSEIMIKLRTDAKG